MAIEAIRGCGYRKVGGFYLVGDFTFVPCDRLPVPLVCCPACGEGIRPIRSWREINPLKLFGLHDPCTDKHRPRCLICQPPDDLAFIMTVGAKFYPTPGDWMQEAANQGVSKRLRSVPRKLKVGKTVIYMSHPRAIVERTEPAGVVQQALAVVNEAEGNPVALVPVEVEETYKLGIFTAFIPQRVEELIWEKDATPERLKDMKKRGITPVIVPDGDLDHA